MARGSPAPIAPTLTSASNTGGGSGYFLQGGVAAPPQPVRSAMGRDTVILVCKSHYYAPAGVQLKDLIQRYNWYYLSFLRGMKHLNLTVHRLPCHER